MFSRTSIKLPFSKLIQHFSFWTRFTLSQKISYLIFLLFAISLPLSFVPLFLSQRSAVLPAIYPVTPVTSPTTPTPSCRYYYWFDNTYLSCGYKNFCSAFMYAGLRVFSTRQECEKELIKPICSAIGTRSEGWYDRQNNLIKYDTCKDCQAVCSAIGTRSEGWYSSCTKTLIKYADCDFAPISTPTPTPTVPNTAPTILTGTLMARFGSTNYKGYITATDRDKDNTLKMTVSDLPSLFSFDPRQCTTGVDYLSRRTLRCFISIPQVKLRPGTYKIKATITDNYGGSTSRYISLFVYSLIPWNYFR